MSLKRTIMTLSTFCWCQTISDLEKKQVFHGFPLVFPCFHKVFSCFPRGLVGYGVEAPISAFLRSPGTRKSAAAEGRGGQQLVDAWPMPLDSLLRLLTLS